MVKQKSEEEEDMFDEEAEFEDDDFEEAKSPKKNPLARPEPRRAINAEEYPRTPQMERTNRFAEPQKPKAEPENRYAAIHSPQVDGILDRRTNKLVYQDLWEVQAEILNVLRRIEESLG